MSAQPIATRPPAAPRRKTSVRSGAKPGTAEVTIALQPSVSPADLVVDPIAAWPAIASVPRPRAGSVARWRAAVLASGVSLLGCGTAVLVVVALARP